MRCSVGMLWLEWGKVQGGQCSLYQYNAFWACLECIILCSLHLHIPLQTVV